MFFRVEAVFILSRRHGRRPSWKSGSRIPEDDPRNPATIADNVSDNVGDVAGLGSDLLESFVAHPSAVILAFHLFLSSEAKNAVWFIPAGKMFLYPIVLAGFGVLACIVGIAYIILKELSKILTVN